MVLSGGFILNLGHEYLESDFMNPHFVETKQNEWHTYECNIFLEVMLMYCSIPKTTNGMSLKTDRQTILVSRNPIYDHVRLNPSNFDTNPANIGLLNPATATTCSLVWKDYWGKDRQHFNTVILFSVLGLCKTGAVRQIISSNLPIFYNNSFIRHLLIW